MVKLEFDRVVRRRSDVVDVDLVRLEVVFQKVVPVEDGLFIRVHHAGTGLNIKARILLLFHLLQRARRVDRLVPASLFAADLFVSFLHPVDPKCDANI